MNTFRNIVIIMAAFVLIGCVNPYTKFYRGEQDATKFPNYAQNTGELLIFSSNDFQRDIANMIRKGYQPFGESHFNGASNQGIDGPLRSHAKNIGASAVLISTRYSHTVSGAVPLVMPTTTTTYSSGTATAYGPGGSVNAYGTGVSTTYGSQTMMMPYSVARSDFDAIFFYKAKRPRVGINPGELDQLTRKRLQTNSGIIVRVVVENSTAYLADIMDGDVVLKISNESVQSLDHYYKLLDKFEGQKVIFSLDRDGKPIDKLVEILHLP